MPTRIFLTPIKFNQSTGSIVDPNDTDIFLSDDKEVTIAIDQNMGVSSSVVFNSVSSSNFVIDDGLINMQDGFISNVTSFSGNLNISQSFSSSEISPPFHCWISCCMEISVGIQLLAQPLRKRSHANLCLWGRILFTPAMFLVKSSPVLSCIFLVYSKNFKSQALHFTLDFVYQP